MEFDDLLARIGPVATRAQLLEVAGRNTLDNEIAGRRLVAIFPRVYARPWDADQPDVRMRAALACAGPPAGLSHLTALRCFGLTAPQASKLHVTTVFRRHPRGSVPGLVVHRTRVRTTLTRTAGMPTVAAPVAIVRSWPLTPGPDQRAPAIEAVRRRLVTPDDLAAANERTHGMPGRTRLAELIGLLAAGCESELEIWGLLHVFDAPGLDHARPQRVFHIRGDKYRTDLAYDAERLGIEMDGDHYHRTEEQRERDRRKDAALASIGWLNLRFGFRRLHDDVAGCRRDTFDTLAARRP